jgi:hypothetical protein
MMVVRCASCGAPLTMPLDVVGADRIDLTVCGDSTLPRGAMVVEAPARTVERWARPGTALAPLVQAPAGSVVVHPEDLLPGVAREVGQAAGCCGLDGQDGPNQGCACGAVLGTAWTDCWTANEVRFLPDAVEVTEAT